MSPKHTQLTPSEPAHQQSHHKRPPQIDKADSPPPTSDKLPLSPAKVLQMQRRLGNKAVVRMLAQGGHIGVQRQPPANIQRITLKDPEAHGKVVVYKAVFYDAHRLPDGQYVLLFHYRNMPNNPLVYKPLKVDPDAVDLNEYTVLNKSWQDSPQQSGKEEEEDKQGGISMGKLEEDDSIVEPEDDTDLLDDEEEDKEASSDKWQKNIEPLDNSFESRVAAFVQMADAFLKNYKVVTQHELGQPSLSDLIKQHMGAPEDSLENDDESIVAKNAEAKEDRDLLAKMVDKVTAYIQKKYGDDEVNSKVALLTLRMAEQGLRDMLAEHKTWKNVALHLGVGGLATFFEDITATVLGSLDMHIKELVPWSKKRQYQDKAMGTLEGVTDVTYNVGGFAAEAVFSPLTNFGTAGIGAAYKGGFAASGAKRGGASISKGSAITTVTTVVEFLQALIPYYGSLASIATGVEEIGTSLSLKKKMKSLVRGKTFTKASAQELGHAKAQPVINSRIERCEELLEMGRKLKSDKKAGKRYQDLLVASKFLREQARKTSKRKGRVSGKGKTPLLGGFDE